MLGKPAVVAFNVYDVLRLFDFLPYLVEGMVLTTSSAYVLCLWYADENLSHAFKKNNIDELCL
jgi:hypothetical protein